MKTKILDGNYISCILSGNDVRGIAISEEEYEKIMGIINNCPVAPGGFGYLLTDELEWELREMPLTEEDEEATDLDYQKALEEMGVKI